MLDLYDGTPQTIPFWLVVAVASIARALKGRSD